MEFNLADIEAELGYKFNNDEARYAYWLSLTGCSNSEIAKMMRR